MQRIASRLLSTCFGQALVLCGCVMLLTLAGCETASTDPDGPSPSAENDVSEPEDDLGDVDPSSPDLTGPMPEFSVTLLASPDAGNAPLEVSFEAQISGGVSADDVGCEWTFDDAPAGSEKSFTNTWYVPATVPVKVCCSYTNAVGQTAVECAEDIIRVEACADLAFEAITIAPPAEVAPGETITLQKGALTNKNGGEISTPFAVEVLLSTNDIYEPDEDVLLERIERDGMESGEAGESSVDLTGMIFTIPADMADGNYFVLFVADAEQVVNECQETNNITQTTNNLDIEAQLAFKPDLVVTSVDFLEGLVLHQGDKLNYTFDVANQGEGETEKFRLAVWLSDDQNLDEDTDIKVTEPGDLGATIQQMAPGGDQNFFNSYTIPEDLPDGEYWLIVMADALEEQAEESEDNNVMISTMSFTMLFELPQCTDLVVESLVVEPLASYWGGAVTAAVTVTNPGTEPTPSKWKLGAYLSITASLNPATVDPSQKFFFEESPIAAGETKTLYKVIDIQSGMPVNPHWLGVILDPDDDLSECNEGNNAALYPDPVTISSTASVDIEVSDVQFHPSTVVAGEDIKVTYNLINSGSTASSGFTVAVVLSEDPTTSISDVNSGEDLIVFAPVVSTVPAAGSIERVDKVNIPISLDHTVNTYYIGVVGDVNNNQASDNNKSNNAAIGLTPLTVLEPQGGCFEDSYEPNNSHDSAKELVHGVYEGLGSCGNDDWYRVAVPAGHSLVVNMDVDAILSLEPVPDDLELGLYDDNHVQLDLSTNSSSHEEVHIFSVAEESEFRLRVFSDADGVRGRYDLDVAVKGPVEGIDLVSTDVTALPAILYPGGLMNVAWSVVNLGTEPASAQLTQIWISKSTEFDAAEPGTAVLVSTVDVADVGPQSNTPQSADILLPDDLSGGYWYFHVVTDSAETVDEADEENNVAVSDSVFLDATLSCADDDFEPNNAVSIATPINLTSGALTLSSLMVCPKLDDWYTVELLEEMELTATVAYPYDEDGGYVTLELWDPSGEEWVADPEYDHGDQ